MGGFLIILGMATIMSFPVNAIIEDISNVNEKEQEFKVTYKSIFLSLGILSILLLYKFYIKVPDISIKYINKVFNDLLVDIENIMIFCVTIILVIQVIIKIQNNLSKDKKTNQITKSYGFIALKQMGQSKQKKTIY